MSLLFVFTTKRPPFGCSTNKRHLIHVTKHTQANMHQYKIVPSILLILSLINVVLAAPVVLQGPEVLLRRACVDMADVPEDVIIVSESEKRSDGLEKRWDTYSNEPWQKRGSSQESSASSPELSVGESPIDLGWMPNPPPPSPAGSPQTVIQDAASSDGDHSSSGEIHPINHGYTSSEGGLGSPSSANDIMAPGTNPSGSLRASQSYPPWNRPQLASLPSGHWSTKSNPLPDRTGSDMAWSKESMSGSASMNHPSGELSMSPDLPPYPEWNPHDWSTSSSEQPLLSSKKKKLMSKTKSFLKKMVYKLKFWPRGPEVL